ncbi:hypothetical protein GUITHDRAFT_70825 [Guillardia theta CCMP2712]|uniref:Protein kinase domain-containing protein n=1 Tax=Guillardia theta (strain CCMP2712) TaxID=905079 RepID=L1JD12_GUITC|nr:hypothetical protein GUITHDRAFT_70825 [Guillardia theta CCMP2712]EKX45990.1 hypothetical protein GUITHDRAFT_70825 [Guillardia theta CCMP2712]|eukprot:XP_005832970.1 hypothetical protein GUITHDRAFT_70825 [Guillardia theta CCMP2712]
MNDYQIMQDIGKSKHAMVYKGRKKKTIQFYALKCVDKSQKQKIMREVRFLHRLRTPYAVQFHEWFETANHLWLILELCPGNRLIDMLQVDLKLPELSANMLGLNLLAALQFLHSNGIVYNNLKPSTILLDAQGLLKLSDFSLAMHTNTYNDPQSDESQRCKRGTPTYMAPELFRPDGVCSFASDLWALGCILYEMVSGRPPYLKSNFKALVTSVVTDSYVPLQNLSEDFNDLCGALLEKNVLDRISWEQVRTHPFWAQELPEANMPNEPAFEEFCAKVQEEQVKESEDAEVESPKRGSPRTRHEDNSLRKSGIDIVRLSQLLFFLGDLQVRPIIGNKKIEKMPLPSFDEKSLSFEPMSDEEICSVDEEQFAKHLADIHRALGDKTPISSKVSVLAYIENLSSNAAVSDSVLNSNVGLLLIRILRESKSAPLRAKLLQTVGVLVRSASFISPELQQAGAIAALTAGVRDREAKVRRRAMAAFGELLYYIVSQAETNEDGVEGQRVDEDEIWSLPPAALQVTLRNLEGREDEVVQHYAAQTIDNICSQINERASALRSVEVLSALFSIVSSAQVEALRGTAASAMSRIVRLMPTLACQIIDKISFQSVIQRLNDDNAKRLLKSLNEQSTIINSILTLFDSATTTVRAKAVLTVRLLASISPQWLSMACDKRLMPSIEKMIRDKDAYLQRCIEGLISEITEMIPNLCVSSCEVAPFHGCVEFRRVLYLVIEALSQNALVLQNHEAVTANLLPVLVQTALREEDSTNSGGSTRYTCLRATGDMLAALMAEVNIYDPAAQAGSGSHKEEHAAAITRIIHELLVRSLFPKFSTFLTDREPVPQSAIKIARLVMERNPAFGVVLDRLGLVEKFISFCSPKSPHFSLNSVCLVRAVVQCYDSDIQLLYSYDIAPQVAVLIRHVVDERSEDDFFEPAVDMLNSLLYHTVTALQDSSSDENQAFWINNAEPFLIICDSLALLCRPDSSYTAVEASFQNSEAASQALLLLAHVFPAKVIQSGY